MPIAVDDGVREPLADFFGRMVRAHLAPPPTGEVRFRMSVCSQDNPSQTALRGPRTRASHLTGPASTRYVSLARERRFHARQRLRLHLAAGREGRRFHPVRGMSVLYRA